MIVKRFCHKIPCCLLPSWASIGDFFVFPVGMSQVSDLTWVLLWDRIFQRYMTLRASQHLANIFLNCQDHTHLKLLICFLLSLFIYFTENTFCCLMIKLLLLLFFFQVCHIQYSALFTEIYFSDTALLSSSWRTSSCVWNLRTGERTLQNFWLLKSWALKGKTAPWRTCAWQHSGDRKSLERLILLKTKGRQH